jgi:reverse gyrase
MLGVEIQEKENFLSLQLRPQWIVKKMLDLASSYEKNVIVFVHFVQEDICEEICAEITKNLRDLGVKVVSYNKKHIIQNVIF